MQATFPRPAWMTTGLAAVALLSSCAHVGHPHDHHGAMSMGAAARAEMQPTRGNAVTGMVMFHTQADGVYLHAQLAGLKPNQLHGFHIHDKGDCSSGDGMSAAGHFNPTAKPHGPPDADHHAGDLPALQADAQGRVDLKLRVAGLSIGSGAADILGRGLIVHADPDDYKTQPTGNSGARVACGVITAMTMR